MSEQENSEAAATTSLARDRFTDPLPFDAASRVSVGDIQAIGFDADSAILIVGLRIGGDDVSLMGTRTVVMKTNDGGTSWSKTLVAGGGSFVPEEIIIYEKNVWLLTQWAIAGTFPTLYFTKDFGDTWEESDNINKFLISTGSNTVNTAEGLRFLNEEEGYVVAQGLESGEKRAYFLKTMDGGKNWEEISTLPLEYFTHAQGGFNWRYNNQWVANEKNSTVVVSRPVPISWSDLLN